MELTLPDGSIFKGKIPETNKKIAEIVGLDASQFLQIAMIAQGDFLRLLLAPSKERKEIFGKIFNTRIYGGGAFGESEGLSPGICRPFCSAGKH